MCVRVYACEIYNQIFSPTNFHSFKRLLVWSFVCLWIKTSGAEVALCKRKDSSQSPLVCVQGRDRNTDSSQTDDLSSHISPLPYSTTKSLLWVMCWLGDNWQVWKKKKDDISEGTLTSMLPLKNPWQWPAAINKEKARKKMKNNFPHKLIFCKRNRNGWENKRGEQAHRATSFSLLFMTIKHNSFLSVSVSPPLNRPLLLVLSIAVHDLAGAAGARLNCAISYVFTLLASFWAYFSPRTFPLTLFCISSTTICCL